MSRPLVLLWRITAAITVVHQRGAFGWIGSQPRCGGQPLSALCDRGMDHEETAQEQRLRLLWQDGRTFETVQRVVDAVLQPDSWDSNVPLVKSLSDDENSRNEYESLFSVLFDSRNEQEKNVTSSNDTDFPNTRTRSFRLDLAYRGPDFADGRRSLTMMCVRRYKKPWKSGCHRFTKTAGWTYVSAVERMRVFMR